MIVEPIASLIEKDLLVGHNHDALVVLHDIIHEAVLILDFNREIMFAMKLSSNQMVPNPGRVASVLMIIVPILKWKRKNLPRVSWMSFTSY